jgi:hypothetical protein
MLLEVCCLRTLFYALELAVGLGRPAAKFARLPDWQLFDKVTPGFSLLSPWFCQVHLGHSAERSNTAATLGT